MFPSSKFITRWKCSRLVFVREINTRQLWDVRALQEYRTDIQLEHAVPREAKPMSTNNIQSTMLWCSVISSDRCKHSHSSRQTDEWTTIAHVYPLPEQKRWIIYETLLWFVCQATIAVIKNPCVIFVQWNAVCPCQKKLRWSSIETVTAYHS